MRYKKVRYTSKTIQQYISMCTEPDQLRFLWNSLELQRLTDNQALARAKDRLSESEALQRQVESARNEMYRKLNQKEQANVPEQ